MPIANRPRQDEMPHRPRGRSIRTQFLRSTAMVEAGISTRRRALLNHAARHEWEQDKRAADGNRQISMRASRRPYLPCCGELAPLDEFSVRPLDGTRAEQRMYTRTHTASSATCGCGGAAAGASHAWLVPIVAISRGRSTAVRSHPHACVGGQAPIVGVPVGPAVSQEPGTCGRPANPPSVVSRAPRASPPVSIIKWG
jgi:hypothetical protein